MKTLMKFFTIMSICLLLGYSPAISQTDDNRARTTTAYADDDRDDYGNWGWIGLLGLLGLLGLRKNTIHTEPHVTPRRVDVPDVP
jgi:hypothetical protein